MRYETQSIEDYEAVCAYCGPGTIASWEVILLDDRQIYVCDKHHTILQNKELVIFERRIGEMSWEDNLELKALLNEYERQRNNNR